MYFRKRKCTISLTTVCLMSILKRICTSEKAKNAVQVCKNYLMYVAKKLSNYGSVRICLLNFTADEDIKSILELFFIEKDKLLDKRDKTFLNAES